MRSQAIQTARAREDSGLPKGSPMRFYRQLLIGVTASTVALSSCLNEAPRDVCGSAETLTSVRSLLLERIGQFQNVDSGSLERAFEEMATIELITFEGYDEEAGTINCRAEVRTNGTASAFEIAYSRQPTIDSDHVYRVEYDGVAGWNALGMGLVSHAKALERQTRADGAVPAASSATSPSPPSSSGPNHSPSADSFRSLTLEDSDGVTLAKFEEWAKDREGGDVSWRVDEDRVHMRLTWKYEDGRQTVVETTFQPTGRDRVRLGATRHDGAVLTSQEAEALINGIMLDMYHRGMTGR